MAFTFNAKAALAEISEAAGKPSTLPIVPTVGRAEPPSAETVGTLGTVEGVNPLTKKTAGGSDVAESEIPARRGEPPTLPTVPTVGPAPDLDAFEERAAIAEYDGGASREEAERAAAREQGYPDPARLAEAIKRNGPMAHGNAASALGWGASRAWRAEAALQRRGLVEYGEHGKAALSALWDDFEARNDPLDPRAWR